MDTTPTTTISDRTVVAPTDATHWVADRYAGIGEFTDDDVVIASALDEGRTVIEVDADGRLEAPDRDVSYAHILELNARIDALDDAVGDLIEGLRRTEDVDRAFNSQWDNWKRRAAAAKGTTVEPERLCSCGRRAVTVFNTKQYGPVPFCGTSFTHDLD